MNDLLSMMVRHGYALTFALLFAEAVGLPFPAAIALVAAGAAIASHALLAPGVLLAAMVALILGDSAQFWLGRYSGWALLGFLCRLSMNPETCILRSAESFYKRGKATLVVAKFIPGVNTMAAPLAGSMKMRYGQFLRLDLAGSLLYSTTYLLVGYLSRDFLAATLSGFHAARRAMEIVVITALVVYAVYRAVQFRKYKKYRVMPRVQVEELVEPWLRTRPTVCSSPTCAAMATTTSEPSGSRDRSASSPTILRKRSRTSPKTKTFTCTVLERAKRLAPGWRIYCRKKASARS